MGGVKVGLALVRSPHPSRGSVEGYRASAASWGGTHCAPEKKQSTRKPEVREERNWNSLFPGNRAI
eukprot:scaffold9326_cov53-Cyclotella_meneghiniana.AAC.1